MQHQASMPPEESGEGKEVTLEFSDIQAFILSGYGYLTHAAYLFLRLPRRSGADSPGTGKITLDARAALRETADEVTETKVEADRSKRAKTALNLGFTYAGLTALGHSEATLATFPPEFRGGMTEDYRARALGDVEESDPKNWEWGGTRADEAGGTMPDPEKMPDLALLCFAEDEAGLQTLVRRVKGRFDDCGAHVVAEERSTPDMHNSSEHFGFRDSITSIPMEGGFGVKDPGQPTIRAGEFLLGYKNEYDQFTAPPCLYPSQAESGVDVGKNGSYLVFRKLKQDVAKFWSYCNAQAANLPNADGSKPPPEFFGAKMVGRWRSGAPLTVCPFDDNPSLAEDPDQVNNFAYAVADPDGFGCPFGAHIRRANPRDLLSTLGPEDSRQTVNHHRVLRRGRSYGPPLDDPATATAEDGVERGLLFFCLNASISRQFEFVQQSWLTDPKFARLWNEPDPLTGSVDNLDDPTEAGAEFTIPQATLRLRLQNVPRFVTVRAGVYLFLPGMTALSLLIKDDIQ